MSNISEFSNVPELKFNAGLDYESLLTGALQKYTEKMQELTGSVHELGAADPRRLLLMAFSYFAAQIGAKLDAAAKSGFLKYATGAALDNLGAMKNVSRRPAVPAKATLTFSMDYARVSATPIPGGTRVTNGSGIFFATNEYAEIPAGSTSVSVSASATIPGVAANGCQAGTLKTIVDLVPYVPYVTNANPSSGGADIQSDDDYTRAIYNAPAAYSVAGPREAYEYHARMSRPDIEEVRAYSPDAGEVNVVFTLEGGALPTSDDIDAMEAYLNDDKIRPLTDLVTAAAPTESSYAIRFTYYISKSDAASADSIQENVAAAVEEYKRWQRHIGRDITPSKLIQLVMDAGAKRVAMVLPNYLQVSGYTIAKPTAIEIVEYGGLEDD